MILKRAMFDVGSRVRQFKVEDARFNRFIGREATVVEMLIDENDQLHLRTDDGIWCPARLMEEVEGQA